MRKSCKISESSSGITKTIQVINLGTALAWIVESVSYFSCTLKVTWPWPQSILQKRGFIMSITHKISAFQVSFKFI